MLRVFNAGFQSSGLRRCCHSTQFGSNFKKCRNSINKKKQPWQTLAQTRDKLTAQGVESSLQAPLKAFLLRLSFGLTLVDQFLSLRLVSSKLGCLDSQTISFGLQRSIFGCEVVHLGLQQRLVSSSLSSNLWLPQRQANKQSKKLFEQRI
jgi:hypothetical protein